MTVKDLQIDSPVYRVQLDSIDVAHIRLIEAFKDGTRKIEITYYGQDCVEKTDASEITTEGKYSVSPTRWYLNIEDAKLAQLMLRSEHVEELKKAMGRAQDAFADAIQRYAFAEPSTPKEL
jgi:hypothetical protein